MKKVGNSKQPLAHQLPIITGNLKNKLKRSYVQLSVIHTDYSFGSEYSYQLCFQPGIDNSECSLHDYTSWQDLLFAYNCLMKDEIPLTDKVEEL